MCVIQLYCSYLIVVLYSTDAGEKRREARFQEGRSNTLPSPELRSDGLGF
jgi:hypothetical protein